MERALLTTSPRHGFGIASDLVTTGAALVGPEYYSLGNGCRVASNATGADGVAGLQALAK